MGALDDAIGVVLLDPPCGAANCRPAGDTGNFRGADKKLSGEVLRSIKNSVKIRLPGGFIRAALDLLEADNGGGYEFSFRALRDFP